MQYVLYRQPLSRVLHSFHYAVVFPIARKLYIQLCQVTAPLIGRSSLPLITACSPDVVAIAAGLGRVPSAGISLRSSLLVSHSSFTMVVHCLSLTLQFGVIPLILTRV